MNTYLLSDTGIEKQFDSQEIFEKELGRKKIKLLFRETIQGAFYYGSQKQISDFKLNYLGIPMELENE